ncbi:hypothetical protein [Chitinophaga qingshengii]|uniref:Uncharacterized protein n=1 Tax=Chitinophaga qingshengii TaxID=1569794 RepID=A0ABR7TNU0_9BACT|nr:hypothetical protein [Chitinophaga qingshengii]MBC9932138.1 hypothetical protein [Chitinophaga qingshengii]
MRRKSINTTTYLLSKGDEKHFGGIKGDAYLPAYDTEIKLFIFNRKVDDASDIENAQTFKLDLAELEAISKGTQFVENSLQTLIALSKRDQLKEDAYFIEEE